MQLYRLLQSHPHERLHVVEADCTVSNPSYRIPEVKYDSTKRAFERGWFYTRTRVPRLYWKMLELETQRQANQAISLTSRFKPEAVLTIHDGFGWITASKVARALGVPLHIILHDEWFRNIPMAASLKPKFNEAFGSVYRGSASRL
jgi:hypothetical protein